MITIEHQDGELNFSFSKGGFCVVDSCLYLSIEAEAVDEDPYPPSLIFAVAGYPINTDKCYFDFALEGNDQYRKPYACFYTTFHSSEVIASIKGMFANDKEVEILFNVLSDDVNYYGEKAKANITKGKVRLKNMPLSELLIPS